MSPEEEDIQLAGVISVMIKNFYDKKLLTRKVFVL